MYRKLVLLAMILTLVVFFLGSCFEKTDRHSNKNKASVEPDSTQVDISTLRDSLSRLIDGAERNFTRSEDILADSEKIIAQVDSVSSANLELKAENQRLNVQLAQAREVIPAMLQSYEDSYEAQRRAIENKDEKITSLNNDLWNANNLNNALSNDQAALQTDLNNMSQWTKKYQHDSKRSFFKVLFGAGKAPVPDVPNPLLE